MKETQKEIILCCVTLLEATLGSMTSNDADKIVSAVAVLLRNLE